MFPEMHPLIQTSIQNSNLCKILLYRVFHTSHGGLKGRNECEGKITYPYSGLWYLKETSNFGSL